MNALLLASWFGHLGILQILVASGATLTWENKVGHAPHATPQHRDRGPGSRRWISGLNRYKTEFREFMAEFSVSV